MQFKTLAIFAAIAGYAAAAPAPADSGAAIFDQTCADSLDAAYEAALVEALAGATIDENAAAVDAAALERRACPVPGGHGNCITTYSSQCATLCAFERKRTTTCLLGCPQEAFAICIELGC